jgi:hypothetical protein
MFYTSLVARRCLCNVIDACVILLVQPYIQNSIENIWLKRLIFQQCGHVSFQVSYS